jgi:tetratricopeptide (TPR) repeat protein/energy-coupling factor transporter ATP-binding protein EcfA2
LQQVTKTPFIWQGRKQGARNSLETAGSGSQAANLMRFETARAKTNVGRRHFPIYGRHTEACDIRLALAESRLVTLVGEPGIGKSSLAAYVGELEAPNAMGGVWLLNVLSGSSDHDLLGKLATIVNPTRSPTNSALLSLKFWFIAHPGIVLIDQADQSLVAAKSVIRQLLQNCPSLKIVATSRFDLELEGELKFRVGPLDTMCTAVQSGSDFHPSSDGAKLFCDRMERLNPEWHPSPECLQVVDQLCAAAGGNPAAILSAASIVAAMGFRAVESGSILSDRGLELVNSLSGEQHYDELFDHLDPDLRDFASELAFLAGEWSIEAADSVTCHRDESFISKRLMDLSNHGILDMRFDNLGNARFSVPDLHLDKLSSNLKPSQRIDLEVRHSRHFLSVATNGSDLMDRKNCSLGMSVIFNDYPNIQLALARELAVGSERSLEFVPKLAAFWQRSRPVSEARDLSFEAAKIAAASPISVWAGRSLSVAATYHFLEGSYSIASAVAEQALAIAGQTGDGVGVAMAKGNIALLHKCERELDRARSAAEEAVETLQNAHEPRRMIAGLNNLGTILDDMGEFNESIECFEETIRIGESINDRWSACRAESNVGLALMHLLEYEAAASRFWRALFRAQALNDLQTVALCLENLGIARRDQSRDEEAVTAITVAQGIREDYTIVPMPQQEAKVCQALEQLLSRLGQNRFERIVQAAQDGRQDWIDRLVKGELHSDSSILQALP